MTLHLHVVYVVHVYFLCSGKAINNLMQYLPHCCPLTLVSIMYMYVTPTCIMRLLSPEKFGLYNVDLRT